jgi:3-deoxy-D-manno-octulosonate 8-phosphate phosphatase (KDO 8-P phosphatase)
MKIKERASKIKMILMDVDGTLTDGTLTVLPDGEELKSYYVRDGMGILMAHLMDLKTGIITGKKSKALEKRAIKLYINELHQGIFNKRQTLEEICRKHELDFQEIAYIGDDLGDLPVIKVVGLSAAVADAHPEIKKHSHMICALCGGKGAVREFIDIILESQGYTWDLIEEKFIALWTKKNTI